MSYWEHIEEAYGATSIHDGPVTFLAQFSRLPEYVGDLLAAHWALSEISNGGLHQFFLNSTGVLAPEAARGFERMGLPQVAELLREGMASFDGTYPREQLARDPFLLAHGREFFEPLEQRLYEVGSPNLSR